MGRSEPLPAVSPDEVKRCATCNRVYVTESDYLYRTSRWRVCEGGHLWFNCSCNSTLLVKKGKFNWYNLSVASAAKL